MNTDKNFLRQKFLKIRQNISFQEKRKKSRIICEKLVKIFLERKNIKNYIALFSGMNDEVNLLSLLQLESENIKFCFPRVIDSKNGYMEFFEIKQIKDLASGNFGILEPKKSCKKVSPKAIDIICIPAVCIDIKGNRIGMGGGFYDRYLALSGADIQKIGVVFEEQVSSKIFDIQSFDIPVQKICTQKALYLVA